MASSIIETCFRCLEKYWSIESISRTLALNFLLHRIKAFSITHPHNNRSQSSDQLLQTPLYLFVRSAFLSIYWVTSTRKWIVWKKKNQPPAKCGCRKIRYNLYLYLRGWMIKVMEEMRKSIEVFYSNRIGLESVCDYNNSIIIIICYIQDWISTEIFYIYIEIFKVFRSICLSLRLSRTFTAIHSHMQNQQSVHILSEFVSHKILYRYALKQYHNRYSLYLLIQLPYSVGTRINRMSRICTMRYMSRCDSISKHRDRHVSLSCRNWYKMWNSRDIRSLHRPNDRKEDSGICLRIA